MKLRHEVHFIELPCKGAIEVLWADTAIPLPIDGERFLLLGRMYQAKGAHSIEYEQGRGRLLRVVTTVPCVRLKGDVQ